MVGRINYAAREQRVNTVIGIAERALGDARLAISEVAKGWERVGNF